MTEKICVASGDGHVGAPTATYKEYLERPLHDSFDEYYASHRWRWSAQSETSYFPIELNVKFRGTDGYDPEHGIPIAWDPASRLAAMDTAMIAGEVLFPDDQNSNDPPWGAGLATAPDGPSGPIEYRPELVQAGARAYNRWLAEFCAVDPSRLNGLTILGTMANIDWVVEEIERAYESGLRTGVLLTLEYDLPSYHHPRYEPVWHLCSELGLTVATHAAKGHPSYMGDDPLVTRFMYLFEAPWYAQRPIWCLIAGGIMERFPDLRLAITEIGTEIDWARPLLQRMDAVAAMWPGMRASRDVPRRVDLSMRPSEYWQRQCFLTHSIAQERRQFDGDVTDLNLVFGADFAHYEGWWPVFGFPEPTPIGQSSMFAGLPVTDAEKAYEAIWGGLDACAIVPYLQDNFFRAFPNVDRAALERVAERVGPTPADIGLVGAQA